MKTEYGTVLGAALFATTLIILPAIAANVITDREKRDCPKDYKAYCGEYGLGTEALRACMSRNIKKISNACVAALVDAGEMTQAQADKLRHKAGPATVTTKKAAVTTKKAKVTKKKVTSKSTKTAKTAKTTKTAKTATIAKTTKKKP